MASKISAILAPKAVNSLLGLCSDDQEALIDVLLDYFCPPVADQSSDEEDNFFEGRE